MDKPTPNEVAESDSIWDFEDNLSSTIFGYVDWTDDYLEKNYKRASSVNTPPVASDAAAHAKVFLSWFFKGKMPSNSASTVKAILMAMKLKDGEFLMAPSLFKGGEALTAPASSEKDTVGAYTVLAVEAYKPGSPTKPNPEGISKEVTKDVVETAYNSLWADLGTKDVQTALNAIGYMVLNCLRYSVKGHAFVNAHWLLKFDESMVKFWGETKKYVSIPPPCSKFSDTFSSVLGKGTDNYSNTIAMLVFTLKERLSTESKGVLMSGCMLSLAENGIGLIHWMIEATKTLSISASTLLKYFAVSSHMKAAMAVKRFIIKYAGPHSEEMSWRWARLINDQAFSDLAAKSDIEMTLILMAISVNGEKDNEIFEKTQIAKSHHEMIEDCCNIAKKLKLHVRKEESKTAKTTQATELWGSLGSGGSGKQKPLG